MHCFARSSFLSDNPRFIFSHVDTHTCTDHRENYKPEFLKSANGIYLRESLSRTEGWIIVYIFHGCSEFFTPFRSCGASAQNSRPPAEIYFFIPAHLVALLSEVNIPLNLFTSEKLGEDSPSQLSARNFRRVSRASPCTKVKNLPDNKREREIERGYFQFALFALCFLPARIDLSSTISRGFDADNPWARLAQRRIYE